MKILDVKFCNLNSLRGEWHIDLTNKIYSSNGIFAITGPTGAGKTTIFDAICLALYTQTPRLGKISGQSNEIMSRKTSQCYAKVIFEVDGKKYIAEWEQHKAGSKLQSARHTLSEISGPILSNKLNNTRSLIEKITGMDFTRFTRAMMLEQNKFDSFLKADKNERAEILELITGTEIYSEVSRRVFQRSKDETSALRELELRLNENKASMTSTSEEEIISQLARQNSAVLELEAQHEITKSQRDTLREIRRLNEELQAVNSDITTQTRRLDKFEHERKILEAAERAETLRADHSQLALIRDNKTKSANNCARLQKDIADSEALLAKVNEYLPEAQRQFTELKGGINEVPEAAASRVKALADNYIDALNERDRLKSDGVRAKKNFEALQALTQQKDELRKLAREKVQKASKAYNEAFDRLIQNRALTTDAILAEQRAILKPNTPCPLCGSLEHPGIEHTEEFTEKADEVLKHSGELEAELKKLHEIVERLRIEQDKADKDYSEAGASMSATEKELEKLRSDWQKKNDDCRAQQEKLKDAIQALGFRISAGIHNLPAQVDEWLEKLNYLDEKIHSAENRKIELDTSIKTLQANLTPELENLEAVTQKLEALELEFARKLSEKNFADENDFINSCKDDQELAHLQDRRREITDRMNKLIALRDDIARKLEAKRSQVTNSKTLEEVNSEFEAQEAQIKSLNGTIAVLTQKLSDFRALQTKINELTQNYNEQKIRAERWAALSNLIGSASGDKLRVIVQRITLEHVVKNANFYLRTMNGRYRLMMTPDNSKLELSVIDSEQADEIRPTENLSGGERFIISLALALGLSQISGSKARVDSLFLDEGFGTLDEEALNTALDALGEVHREGRMIGIISHVQALKERIAAQIQVIPKSEGVSILEGPGCSGKI